MPTSDERREVAERLRALADGESPMTECSVAALYIALGLPYLGSGLECAAIGYLADLIDRPSCKNVSDFGSHMVTVRNFSKNEYFDFVCDRCGTYLKSDEMEFSPLRDENCELRALHFCPYCGAEVVDE